MPTPNTPKRKRYLGFRIFLGTNPKTKRQKKAHSRAVAQFVQKPDEPAPLTELQKKKRRLKKGREFRKKEKND
jgi:hypothetical protein